MGFLCKCTTSCLDMSVAWLAYLSRLHVVHICHADWVAYPEQVYDLPWPLGTTPNVALAERNRHQLSYSRLALLLHVIESRP